MYCLLGIVVLGVFWAIAGKSAWIVLAVTLFFFNSLYFSASLPEEKASRRTKILQALQTVLHRVFCYLAVPVGVLSLIIAAAHYGEAYPFVASALRGIAAFLFVLPIIFMLRETKRRGVKLTLYFCVMTLFISILLPQYYVPTGTFMGKMMARGWLMYTRGSSVIAYYPGMRISIVNETEAVLFTSMPPVMLFISAQEERPYCMGYPQSAEKSCQYVLEERRNLRSSSPDIESPAYDPPAAEKPRP
jgi:hypothetical protein